MRKFNPDLFYQHDFDYTIVNEAIDQIESLQGQVKALRKEADDLKKVVWALVELLNEAKLIPEDTLVAKIDAASPSFTPPPPPGAAVEMTRCAQCNNKVPVINAYTTAQGALCQDCYQAG